MGRTLGSNSRMHRYQRSNTRDPTRRAQDTIYPVESFSVYSSSATSVEDSERATSPRFDEAALVRIHGTCSYLWIYEGPFVWIRLIFVIV